MSDIAANTEIKFEKGLVGFFDILGYQSFLDKNSAEEAVKEVLSTLNSIDIKIADTFESIDLPEAKTIKSYIEKNFEWLIFSDTILILGKYYNDKEENLYHWMIFLMVASLLCRKMFNFGLPVRGAISFGDFIKQKVCFAGKPIVEAYRTTENLNLAACVLSKSAEIEFERCLPFESKLSSNFQGLLVKYLVPFKRYSESKKHNETHTLTFYPKIVGQNDIRQTVLNSFWKHNKDIEHSVHSKIDNTEKFLRFLVFKLKKEK